MVFIINLLFKLIANELGLGIGILLYFDGAIQTTSKSFEDVHCLFV